MHRVIRRSAIVALPALLIALGAGAAVTLPAQAASTWSAPAPVPAGRFAENAAGAQAVTWSSINETTFLTSVEVSTSANGLTWSAPVTLTTGSDAAPAPVVAVAPNGRVVVAWTGGPSTGPVVQSSVLPPGGTWSAPVNVSTDIFGDPVLGMDGSGNAIVAWLGGNRQIRTASLPASSTTWTAVNTLDTAVAGFALNLAVSSSGSVLVTWVEALRTVWADSGTVLGGFAAPVIVTSAATTAAGTGDPARVTLDADQSPGLSGARSAPAAYFVGHTQAVLANSGIAELQFSAPGSAGTAIRSAAGTWSIQAVPGSVAIDGAGDLLSVTQQTSASGVTSVYTSKLPAGSSTWSTPVALAVGSSPLVAGDAAGTFVVALQTAAGPAAYTSPPGGGFGAAATFPAADTISGLTIMPGRAALFLSAGVSTEVVS
jgi:hypothetical protein